MTNGVLEFNAGIAPSHQAGAYQTDAEAKARVLAALRIRLYLDSPEVPVVDALFEDLDRVLGEGDELTAPEIADLTPRLHLVFRRVRLAAGQPSSGVLPTTLAASRHLLVERFPQELVPARGHVRRLALALSDLLDELLEDMP
ncbi:DUF6415 family natural product biosynthesis protein [Streptomyces monashensis]|uniref:DUF6415 family natural product biosynthesis protein n=1 Tax=Streptomyces monashensis TaxID=1678012 RepID=UPI0034106787